MALFRNAYPNIGLYSSPVILSSDYAKPKADNSELLLPCILISWTDSSLDNPGLS